MRQHVLCSINYMFSIILNSCIGSFYFFKYRKVGKNQSHFYALPNQVWVGVEIALYKSNTCFVYLHKLIIVLYIFFCIFIYCDVNYNIIIYTVIFYSNNFNYTVIILFSHAYRVGGRWFLRSN